MRVTFVDGLCSALPGTPPTRSSSGDFSDPHEATIDDCIHIAVATGAGAVNLVHIGGVATPVPQLAEAFAHACARAADDGIRLAIEFLPGTGIPDFATAAAVVREAGAPNGSVLLDTWHFARGGGTLSDLDPPSVALVGGLQLSDRSPDQDLEPYVPERGRKLPGKGALPLAEIVTRVAGAHPDLPIGAEVLSDEVDAFGLAEGTKPIADRCGPRRPVDVVARLPKACSKSLRCTVGCRSLREQRSGSSLAPPISDSSPSLVEPRSPKTLDGHAGNQETDQDAGDRRIGWSTPSARP